VITLTFFSPAPLSAGPAEFASLTATVPASAPYGAAHVLELSGVSINEAATPATADDSIHVVALLGDTTGNGQYSGLDAQRVARIVVGLDSGLAAFPTIDPILLGDATGNGSLSGLDAQRIAQQVVGLDPPEIPTVPDETLANAGRTANRNAAAVDAVLAQMEAAASQNAASPARDVAASLVDLPQRLVDPATVNEVEQSGRCGRDETLGADSNSRRTPALGTATMRDDGSLSPDDDFNMNLESESRCLDATAIDACFAEEAVL
jgi:hypothetical protein